MNTTSFWDPCIVAIKNFFFETKEVNHCPPFIRDAINVKRWMMLVIIALIPCTLMGIWNTGMLKTIYGSGSSTLLLDYLKASTSLSAYCSFVMKKQLFIPAFLSGISTVLPLIMISYLAGGVTEVVVAGLRKRPIAEGFLVSGLLYPLILPPTIPYWMVAVGISFGILISKEVFGGTGMNIVNPALTCRAFLYFAFPGKMTGDIWVGSDPTLIQKSLSAMHLPDAITTASPLSSIHTATGVHRIHVDAIAERLFSHITPSHTTLEQLLPATPPEQLPSLLSSALELPPEHYSSALSMAKLMYGLENYAPMNLMFGNIPGSIGETSFFACVLGAVFLLCMGIASYRTMLGTLFGALITAFAFQCSTWIGSSLLHPALYALPAYQHLYLGGLAFGLVFMATDPVSSPSQPLSQWIYGILIGMLTILIRLLNPAFPEGVMFAILFGNILSPFLDYYITRLQRAPLGVQFL